MRIGELFTENRETSYRQTTRYSWPKMQKSSNIATSWREKVELVVVRPFLRHCLLELLMLMVAPSF